MKLPSLTEVAGKKSRVACKKSRVVKKLQTVHFIESRADKVCKITLSFSYLMVFINSIIQYERIYAMYIVWIIVFLYMYRI